jgi:LPPG:FO 2-phospho-L-lactate transferase
MYTLAGIVDKQKGWGVKDDTFACLDALNRYYGLEKWFNLGDRDLATHIYRTRLLGKGHKLSEITEKLCSSLGIRNVKVVPMTDDKVETMVKIQDGSMINFQEYFVKRGCKDQVKGIHYNGSRSARPASGVIESINSSDIVILCPSNPIASIGPILSVRGISEALKKATCPVVAISPIISGKPLKGPADKFMKGLGLEVSALGVAKFYEELIDYFVLDESDVHLEKEIKLMGIDTIITDTVMNSLKDKVRLAGIVLKLVNKG